MTALLAVALGAVIALAATLLAETLRARSAHATLLSQVRYEGYLGYIVAYIAANDALHAIAVRGAEANADDEVGDAMRRSGLYAARERLLITGSPEMVLAAETAFRSLLDVRDAVARRVPIAWPDYRPANDGLAREVWALRQAARREFGGAPLDLEKINTIRTAGIAERVRPTGEH
jgi:hypothetical protein